MSRSSFDRLAQIALARPNEQFPEDRYILWLRKRGFLDGQQLDPTFKSKLANNSDFNDAILVLHRYIPANNVEMQRRIAHAKNAVFAQVQWLAVLYENAEEDIPVINERVVEALRKLKSCAERHRNSRLDYDRLTSTYTEADRARTVARHLVQVAAIGHNGVSVPWYVAVAPTRSCIDEVRSAAVRLRSAI